MDEHDILEVVDAWDKADFERRGQRENKFLHDAVASPDTALSQVAAIDATGAPVYLEGASQGAQELATLLALRVSVMATALLLAHEMKGHWASGQRSVG